MISTDRLQGCHVALITPMTQREHMWVVDHDHLARLIEQCIDAGVTGLLFAGTTGQGATLRHDEQVDLVARGAAHARRVAAERGREVVIIGNAGSNCTHEALSLTRRIAEVAQPDALLHVTGYYNNPPQEGLRHHFETIANLAAELGTGVILYNIPGRTQSRIEHDTLVALAKHPAIVGVKDATGDLEAAERLIDAVDYEKFAVLSGEDHLVAELMRRGGRGVISASANRWPREFQRLTELCAEERWNEAEELQRALQPCVDACFAVKNPIPLAAMFETGVRSPLITVDRLDEPRRTEVQAKIDRALAITAFPHVQIEGSVRR